MASILVVDDEVAVRNVIRTILVNDGHHVRCVADGEQALAAYKTARADIVIIDIFMPRKDGIETIRELRAEAADTKIIAMSGGSPIDADFSYLGFALGFGADHVLQKPFNLQTVRDLIASCINDRKCSSA